MIAAGLMALGAALVAVVVIGGALAVVARLAARRERARRRPAPRMIELAPRPALQRIEVVDVAAGEPEGAATAVPRVMAQLERRAFGRSSRKAGPS